MDIFLEYSNKHKGAIEKALSEYVQLNANDFDVSSSKPLEYIKKPFVESFGGGKMIRAILVCLGFEIANGAFDERIITPSIAFEVFQTSVLFHDDIIDQGDFRRGKKTIHKVLESFYRTGKIGSGESVHKSTSMVICLGDYGFNLTSNIILDSDFDDKLKIKALRGFSSDIKDTIVGEMLDVELPSPAVDGFKVLEEDIIKIAEYKTAQYTISGPLKLGAVLAGASDQLCDGFSKFGNNLGIAFQIHDDIMGIYGKKIGKPTDSDIKEKKFTLLYNHALNNGDSKAVKFLKTYYGNKRITKRDADCIRKIFIDTGSLEYSELKRNEYKEAALRALECMKIPDASKAILRDFAEYIVERDK